MKIVNSENIKKADLVVGIPSYKEAKTIGFVVEQVARGLKEHFPKLESVIINVDNNSPDGTKGAFLNSKSEIPLIYASTPGNIKGKGHNFHNLLHLFKCLEAKAGIVVDADLKSIKPGWIKKLADPIFSGYGYVTPLYARRKDDAFVTNQIVYPLIYGLMGFDIRQPIGGEFAFSNELVDIWLSQEWKKTTYQFGIDIFMSLNAIFSGLKIGQVNLGSKIHKSSTPNLGPMFIQVVGTLFGVLSDNLGEIKKVKRVKKIPTLNGKTVARIKNSAPYYHNFEKLFEEEFDLNQEWFEKCLDQLTYNQIEEMREKRKLKIDSELWVKIIYDFLYHYNMEKNSEIIEALRCLFFGRVATHFKNIAKLSPSKSEDEVLKQAKYFFKNRGYYLKKNF